MEAVVVVVVAPPITLPGRFVRACGYQSPLLVCSLFFCVAVSGTPVLANGPTEAAAATTLAREMENVALRGLTVIGYGVQQEIRVPLDEQRGGAAPRDALVRVPLTSERCCSLETEARRAALHAAWAADR